MGKIHFLAILLFSCVLTNCTDTPKPNYGKEDTFLLWQQHIDRNEFEQARKLSSASVVEWINTVEEVITLQPQDSALENTIIKELSCSPGIDSCSCHYTIEEEGILYSDSIRLVKVEGQWLVDFFDDFDVGGFNDLPKDSILFYLEKMEQSLQ